MSVKQRISRRATLRGMGAFIALPYLDLMGGKTIAATAAKKEPPRLACFYIPGGINHYNWFPKDTGFKYELAPTHKPLEKFRDNFTVLSNLSHIEGRISGHVHPYNWLTGHNINLTPGAITNSISMDQVAAKHLGPTWLPSMVLSWRDGVGTSTLSRNSLGVDIPAMGNHRSVFEQLFPPADKDQLKQAKARIELNRSVLDTALGDVKDLHSRLGSVDRQRVEQYLQSIREVERRLDDRKAVLEAGRPKFDESKVVLQPEGKNSFQEQVEQMMDLVALAFQTDMTRVVTQVLGGEGGPNYDEYKQWAGKTGAPVRGAHDVHHKGSGARGEDNPDVRVLGMRDEMLVAALANLMKKLDSIQAKDGTLLDHSAILFGGSQISSHSGKSFPTLLAGGKQLGFKHGQHIKWKTDERSMSDLYLTILTQLGCPVDVFKESRNAISEILA